MADELKTILEIDGVSTGAERAIDRTIARAQELPAAVGAANVDAAGTATTEQAAASREAAAAMTDQAGAAGDASQATQDLGESAGISRIEIMNLAATIGGIDPRLAMLIRMAYRTRGALQLLFSPIGLGIGAVAAAVWGVSQAIGQMTEQTRRAKRVWDELIAAQAESRRLQDVQQAGIGKGLAAAGIYTPASAEAARKIENQLKKKGYGEEQIRAVMPIAVDQAGKQQFTDEELERLADLAEFEPEVFKVEGKRGPEIAERKARKKLATEAPKIDQYGAQRRDLEQRKQQRLLEFNEAAIDEALQKQGERAKQLPKDEAQRKQAIEDIKAVTETGRIQGTGLHGTDREDAVVWQARQLRAADRAFILGTINRQQRFNAMQQEISGAGFGRVVGSVRDAIEDQDLSEIGESSRNQPPMVNATQRNPAATTAQPAVKQPTTQPTAASETQTSPLGSMVRSTLLAPAEANAAVLRKLDELGTRILDAMTRPGTVNQNFHGLTYVGRPGDRFATKERVPQ